MSPISRRTFLWLTGGSGVALATAAPRKVVNRLIPQVIPPEQIQPGEWAFFATTCRECPAGCGMVLWHRDGRVTKAEGNPLHPVNRGGLCPRGQSALQGLYDPDRLREVQFRSGGAPRKRGWEPALAAIGKRLAAGGRVAVLSRIETGALAEVMDRFSRAFGGRKVLYFEPFNYEPLKSAHAELFGSAVIPSYNFSDCDLIVSFAADFLETWISPVSFARDFADMHALRAAGPLGRPRIGRFVYVGPRLSMTAASADEFIQVPPGYERVVAAALLNLVAPQAKRDVSAVKPALERYLARCGELPGVTLEQLAVLARAFVGAASSVAVAGPVGSVTAEATETAAAAALLNYAAGRIGQTVDFSRPHALSAAAREEEVEAFLTSLGTNDVLIVHDANPLYGRPGLAPLLKRVGTVVYLGTMADETARVAHWALPIDAPLESWGEYAPVAGVNGLLQPTMGRLYDTRLAGDLFLELSRRGGRPLSREGGGPQDFPSWLRSRWESGGGPEWTEALRNGGSWENPPAGGGVTLAGGAAAIFDRADPPPPPPRGDSADLWLWGSVLLHDGRVANRGWLQETPDPMTFMVWGNWASLHPETAAQLGVAEGDLVEVAVATRAVRVAVHLTTEVSERTVALSFGQGHQGLGATADGVGVNAFLLLDPAARIGGFGRCRIGRAGEGNLYYTAGSREQYHRDLVQWVPLSEVSRMASGDGDRLVLPLPEGYRRDKDLYPKRFYTTHRWAMVADLQRCIGCGACTVACYAENNVPVIGRPKIGDGREMTWLRVTPFQKPEAPLRYGWLPLLCQHCDAAPCEPVCPVFAAMHNEEGLNAQIYNRCIGTRYCSNNCPYKVRRFNWEDVDWRPPLDLQLNPEVTVRGRGVMEKCTFCVQRIRQAEYRAAVEGREIRDGEIQPACAQSCPTRVYTFGDLLDPNSQVSRLTRGDPRRYHLLEDLNTKPAVTYLRRIDQES